MSSAEMNQESTASKKESFDLCLEMLQAYYSALEGRIEKSVGMLIVVIGWLISSEKARDFLSSNPVVRGLAITILTILVILYCVNILHWLSRFKQIRSTIEKLNYVDEKYYDR